jgi:mono/diheme cytochrome c family protein
MRLLFYALLITLLGPASLALAAGAAPTYSKDVAPFLKKYCVDCHNSNKAKAGFDLETYDSLVGEGKKGRAAVVPGNPDKSRVVMVLEGNGKQMPPRKSPQPDKKEVAKLRDWIADGAKNDLAKDAKKDIAKADPKKDKAIAAAKKAPAKNARPARSEDDDDDDDVKERMLKRNGREMAKERGDRGRRKGERDDDD